MRDTRTGDTGDRERVGDSLVRRIQINVVVPKPGRPAAGRRQTRASRNVIPACPEKSRLRLSYASFKTGLSHFSSRCLDKLLT